MKSVIKQFAVALLIMALQILAFSACCMDKEVAHYAITGVK